MVALIGGLGFTYCWPHFWVLIAENRLLDSARERILDVRRGHIDLEFGAEHAGETISIIQRTHAFRFGCNLFQYGRFETEELNQYYLEKVGSLFNYATLPFYWNFYEYFFEEYPHTGLLHNMTAWANASGLTTKGHPLIWQNDCCLPDWVSRLPLSGQRDAAYAYVEKVLTEFPEITTWDLMNEMTNMLPALFGPSAEDAWKNALLFARDLRPDAEFIVNEFNFGERASISEEIPLINRYDEFLENIIRDGSAPDAIGIQFHCVAQWVELERMEEIFTRFGRFGIPLHITEFSPGSQGRYDTGPYRGRMTPESQAQFAERAYILMFSHPAIDAITWWDFAHTPAWEAWKYDQEPFIMGPTGELKPVYDRLYNLIHHEWNSTTTITLDSTGRASFTGFFGDYETQIGPTPYYFTIR
jgi:GH35 family endo-1,4-beta-xylanase